MDISEEYDNFRADLFMIGLLWLEFLRINKKGFLDDFLSLKDVKEKVSLILKDLSEEKDHKIISQLLDFDKYPEVTIEDVIR